MTFWKIRMPDAQTAGSIFAWSPANVNSSPQEGRNIQAHQFQRIPALLSYLISNPPKLGLINFRIKNFDRKEEESKLPSIYFEKIMKKLATNDIKMQTQAVNDYQRYKASGKSFDLHEEYQLMLAFSKLKTGCESLDAQTEKYWLESYQRQHAMSHQRRPVDSADLMHVYHLLGREGAAIVVGVMILSNPETQSVERARRYLPDAFQGFIQERGDSESFVKDIQGFFHRSPQICLDSNTLGYLYNLCMDQLMTAGFYQTALEIETRASNEISHSGFKLRTRTEIYQRWAQSCEAAGHANALNEAKQYAIREGIKI